MRDDPWAQIRAGVALICWSRLARWDSEALAFVPATKENFESADGHAVVHKEFGRLLCWLSFAVGAEYLAKGVCLFKGLLHFKSKKVVRPPTHGEEMQQWAEKVLQKNPTAFETTIYLGTLNDLPLDKVADPGPAHDLLVASFELLRSAIRNRDAHHYTKNTRTFNFPAVEAAILPSLNLLLATVDQERLRNEVVNT